MRMTVLAIWDMFRTMRNALPKRRLRDGLGLALALALTFTPCFSIPYGLQTEAKAAKAPPVAASPYSYADIADLAARATTVAVARIKRISPVRADLATNSQVGTKRYYVEADVQSLIRGEAALARRIGFVIDLPDERNAAKAIKGRTFILFGRTGGKPDRMQLVSSNALLPLTTTTEAKVKSITAELLKPDAPPAIPGIGEAFHVKGTVAGEGETQIFLLTDGGQPVSLSIIRRPDMAPRFGVALGEVVDEAATIPASDTLLWYRLACILPGALPDSAVAKLEAADADAARTDYRAFMDQLGPCPRTRPAKLGNSPAPG
jgi:hypothetical protein